MSVVNEKNVVSADAAYRVCGRVVIRRIGSDTLLVPVSGSEAGGRVFPVNESALIVWESVAGSGTVQAAAEALVDRYALPIEKALEDCKVCINTFLNEGLLEDAA